MMMSTLVPTVRGASDSGQPVSSFPCNIPADPEVTLGIARGFDKANFQRHLLRSTHNKRVGHGTRRELLGDRHGARQRDRIAHGA